MKHLVLGGWSVKVESASCFQLVEQFGFVYNTWEKSKVSDSGSFKTLSELLDYFDTLSGWVGGLYLEYLFALEINSRSLF